MISWMVFGFATIVRFYCHNKYDNNVNKIAAVKNYRDGRFKDEREELFVLLFFIYNPKICHINFIKQIKGGTLWIIY